MKNVLVTGASSGIGRAIAEKFHDNGYFVYLLARDPKRLGELSAQLSNSKSIHCDLADPKQIADLPKQVDFQKLEILVNNAGIYFTKPAEEFLTADWQTLYQVNVFAPAQLSGLVLPHFKAKKSGSIVMVTSTLGSKPVPLTSAYSSSKAALQNLAMTLALEAAPYGIRVNSVAPGIVETPIHGFDTLSGDRRNQVMATMNTLQPLARMGQPRDIAEAVYFLGTDSSSWTTGATFNVDGGINIK